MSAAQEIANPQWLPISNLRRAKYNYSGWPYSYDWAKSNNLLEYVGGGSEVPIRTVYISEPLGIRLNAEGGIDYRRYSHASAYHDERFANYEHTKPGEDQAVREVILRGQLFVFRLFHVKQFVRKFSGCVLLFHVKHFFEKQFSPLVNFPGTKS